MAYENAIEVLTKYLKKIDEEIEKDRNRLIEKLNRANNDQIDYADEAYDEYRSDLQTKAGLEFAIQVLLEADGC